MNSPDMLQKAINPKIKRPSFGQKNQGNGSILLFIKLQIESFDSWELFSVSLDLIFLLDLLLKGTFACIPLSRLKAILPSL